jgi:transcription elongation factor Elf1
MKFKKGVKFNFYCPFCETHSYVFFRKALLYRWTRIRKGFVRCKKCGTGYSMRLSEKLFLALMNPESLKEDT